MNSKNFRLIGGIGLVLLGLLYLFQSLHILPQNSTDFIWTLAFFFGGAIFIYVFMGNRTQNWWALIPGVVLAGLGLTIAMEILFPDNGGELGGAVFLASVGLAFLAVYLNNTMFWWALIPTGTMLSLSAVVILDTFPVPGFDSAGILLFGLAATFLVLALLPLSKGRQSWAMIPAIPLLILGFVVGIDFGEYWKYIWPAIIILLGGLFLYQGIRK
ncbi:MAG: hypothetical protein JXA19_06350 [Anaerolineales bacterium]|nr:hypothetical protein [Anaerolineales bacterium]